MIKQEDFLKLKQNDRIEFLLRLNRIEKKQEDEYSSVFGTIYLFMGIVGFLIIIILLLYLTGVEGWYEILGAIKPLGYAFFVLILFQAIWNIFNNFRFMKKRNELESEFFKEEIKPNK